jgi:septal ring factor EnvC (AmiA/AmiB activator)
MLALSAAPGALRAQPEELERKFLEEKSKLKTMVAEIEEERHRVRESQKKEASVLSQLSAVEKKIHRKKKELKKTKQGLKELDAQVAATDEEIAELTVRLDFKQSYVTSRLVSLYKFQQMGTLPLLLSAETYSEALQRYRGIRAILNQDAARITDYRATLDQLEGTKNQLTDMRREAERARTTLAGESTELARMRAQKVALLESVRTEKKHSENLLQELEQSSVELQSLIEELDRQLQGKGPGMLGFRPRQVFAALRGKLGRPVSGKIISTYGKRKDPKLNTYTFQKGIQIEAPEGAEIRAVSDGVVVYSGWFEGYGNLVIIDHGESYYSLSAHASELFVEIGDEVNMGDVVALVGDTDSLRGTVLHFELRHHGKPLNPMEWFTKKE